MQMHTDTQSQLVSPNRGVMSSTVGPSSLLVLLSLVLAYSEVGGQLAGGRCFLRCRIPLTVDMRCGSNGVTYQNEQELLCAKMLCYPDLYQSEKGRCVSESPTSSSPGPSPTKLSFAYLLNTKAPPSYWPFTRKPALRTTSRTTTPIPPPESLIYSDSRPKVGKTGNELGSGHAGDTDCLDDCVCGLVLSPVCASNRITYGNTCILDCVKNACEPELEFHHDGFCGKIFFGVPLRKLSFFRLYSAEKGILT